MIYSDGVNQISMGPDILENGLVSVVYEGKEFQGTLINFSQFQDGSWSASVTIPRHGLGKMLGPKTLELRG